MRHTPTMNSTSSNDIRPSQSSTPDSIYMSDDFARVYEMTGNRVTAPIAMEALRRVGLIPFDARILDIAAGAGALSIPAAHGGASVLAVDIAPGMVRLLSERLAPFPCAAARVMDGEDLRFPNQSFDLAFSIMGISLFNDWRKGLSEMNRVLRPGGKACIATWKTPPGGGPFLVMARALSAVFPGRVTLPPPEGFRTLADPAQLMISMHAVGFTEIEVTEFDTIWRGHSGHVYLDELQRLHRYMKPYAELSDDERRRVDEAILGVIEEYTVEGHIRIASPVLLAVATKR
jgi:ubiquinone/menaquinone biosynthesis C-methylase UbiE